MSFGPRSDNSPSVCRRVDIGSRRRGRYRALLILPLLILLLALCVFVGDSPAIACPKAAKLLDFNCDTSQRIAFTGDSIVRGVGDELVLDGYVGRLSVKIPGAEIVNIGVKGITSRQLLQAFKSA